MSLIYAIPIVLLCYWIIWHRGAEYLEDWAGSLLIFGHSLDAREIRFAAAIALVTVPIFVFFL
jgi:hypothetical protein